MGETSAHRQVKLSTWSITRRYERSLSLGLPLEHSRSRSSAVLDILNGSALTRLCS
eukprot:COSAG06_NODE_929_length_11465_cov_4.106722_9_plen_56_part_00